MRSTLGHRGWHAFAIAVLLAVSLGAAPAAADGAHYTNIKQPAEELLETGKTILDQPLHYPTDGAPVVKALMLTVAPGEETVEHQHGVPMFVYMLAGELEVDYENQGTQRVVEGDTFMEATGVWHKGRNTGDKPARILVVFMGTETAPSVIRRD